MARTADSTSSTSDVARKPAPAPGGVPLGRVVGAHGVGGELRVRLGGGDGIDLTNVTSVRLARDGDRAGEGDAYAISSIRSGRAGECRLALVGVCDRDAALALRGRTVLARSDELPPLPAGEYYAYELVGCVAEDTAGRVLGRVKHLIEAGAHDVLAIEDDAGGEHLVPAVEPLLVRVDLGERRIVLDPPPGLLDAPVAGGRGPCSEST